MDKNKKILIILLILLSIGLTFIMIYLLNNSFNFNITNGTSNELIYDKNFENIYDSINIKSEAANIYIKQSNDNNINIKIYGNTNYSSINNSNNILYIEGNTEKCSFFCINKKSAKIEVYLPKDYDKSIEIYTNVSNIDIDNFQFATLISRTNVGDININNINKADIKNETGDVNIENINIGIINLNTGDIIINNINEIDGKTNTGDININKINNYLYLSSNTGDIKIDNLNIDKNSEIKNNIGDIVIKNTNEIYISAKTDIGDIKINNNYRNAIYELNITNDIGDIKIDN